MTDALAYTQLSDSNISSKLPEIAMRQYKIAEANREKTEKQHTDLIGLFKYKVEGFNPDITGLTKGYEAIVQKGSEIALKQGYAAAQQYVQTQKDLLDGIGKMSSAQKQKSDLLFKDLSDKKKWNEDPEGYIQSMENYKKYVMSDEPTKQDYANIRKKYGYSDAIPDEALRAVIRQNTFGEGESILNYEPIGDYRKGAKDWALNPTTKETSMGEYTMGKDGNIYHGTRTETKYNKSMLENQMSDFFALGKTDTGANVYKAAERELKKSGAIPQNVDVNTPEGYKQVFDAWKTRPSTMELFKKEGEKTTITESKISEGNNYGWNGYGFTTKNAVLTPSVEESAGYGSTVKDKPVVYMKITEGANSLTMPTQGTGWVWDGKSWSPKDFSTQTVLTDPVIKYQDKVGNFGGGFYVVGNRTIQVDGKNKTTQVAVDLKNNISAIANELRTDEKSVLEMVNKSVDTYNEKHPESKISYIGGNKSTPTQQKTSNTSNKYGGVNVRR